MEKISIFLLRFSQINKIKLLTKKKILIFTNTKRQNFLTSNSHSVGLHQIEDAQKENINHNDLMNKKLFHIR